MSSKTNSGKELYTVIHCVALSQGGCGHALRNARIAIENNADGVFLIGHKVPASQMVSIYAHVRQNFPNLWIGINFLDASINRDPEGLRKLVRQCKNLNALWTDEMPNGDYNDHRLDTPIFGGVAFKGQNPGLSGEALYRTCEDAIEKGVLITTSGDSTGTPASIKKLEEIHHYINGRSPLAVASGVDALNVTEMKPFVDIFLVASSITRRSPEYGNQEYLVPERVRVLADLIHG